MVVPFGVGVGDFLAVSTLIAQVGRELQRNGHASPEYQQVVLELEALDRALKQLFLIKPAEHELLRLDTIRALATTCRAPLEAFLQKISQFESHLGPWNSAEKSVRGFSKRIQWSLKYSKDLFELRQKLASHVGTINLLLLTQTVESLNLTQADQASSSRNIEDRLILQGSTLSNINDNCRNTATALLSLNASQASIESQAKAQANSLSEVSRDAYKIILGQEKTLEKLKSHGGVLARIDIEAKEIRTELSSVTALIASTEAIASSTARKSDILLSKMLDILQSITQGVRQLRRISAMLSDLFHLITNFTAEMRQAITILLTTFYKIQSSLSRLEAFIPFQICLPIVKFRDPFGSLMALPYDLCKQWKTFQALVNVAFIGKQGSWRVESGQYTILHNRLGKAITPVFWHNAILEGDEISMSIILQERTVGPKTCPWPSCRAKLSQVPASQGGKFCTECNRWISVSLIQKTLGVSGLPSTHRLIEAHQPESMGDVTTPEYSARIPSRVSAEPINDNEDIELYRLLQVPVHGYDACGILRPGAQFVGTQQTGLNVEVSVLTVSVPESFMSGYFRIEGLTPDHLTLTTYFEAELIGTRYGFSSSHPPWESDKRVNTLRWTRFPAFRRFLRDLKNDSLESLRLEEWWNDDDVFMRWKELHQLDPRARIMKGINFEGFYYIHLNQRDAKISGTYFDLKKNRHPQLELRLNPNASTFWRF